MFAVDVHELHLKVTDAVFAWWESGREQGSRARAACSKSKGVGERRRRQEGVAVSGGHWLVAHLILQKEI